MQSFRHRLIIVIASMSLVSIPVGAESDRKAVARKPDEPVRWVEIDLSCASDQVLEPSPSTSSVRAWPAWERA